MPVIAAWDQRLTWDGHISLERIDDGITAWRIPYKKKALYPEELYGSASCSAGIRIRFCSDSIALELHVKEVNSDIKFDIQVNGKKPEKQVLRTGETCLHIRQDNATMSTFEIWLPQSQQVQVTGLSHDEGSSVLPWPETRKRFLVYGSSITQCGAAASPGTTWPAVTARTLNMSLTCLGFSGQCHADPMIARLIRDTPTDLIVLSIGINIRNRQTFKRRTFLPALYGFHATIRDEQPTVPMVFLSPIFCPLKGREDGEDALTLDVVRTAHKTAV